MMTGKQWRLMVALVGVVSVADALECEDGTLVDVAGTIDTVNLSRTIQVGRIQLTLTDAFDGSERFAATGGLMGQVGGFQADGTAVLNHYICFDGDTCLMTRKDRARLIPAADPFCADGSVGRFDAVERVSQAKGKAVFKGVDVAIEARGRVSYCPEDGGNHFQLTGVACLRSESAD